MCWRDAVSRVFLGPLACLPPLCMVGLGWADFLQLLKGPEEACALKLSLAGCVGEVAKGGLVFHQLNHRQKSDLIHSLITP